MRQFQSKYDIPPKKLMSFVRSLVVIVVITLSNDIKSDVLGLSAIVVIMLLSML